ncbi:MAG TPA: pyruvate kinase [Candidatus Bathyarchaeia archaeon]|nr:pyruvate kinase [Candidatus Bathyarchaeia archaeon]
MRGTKIVSTLGPATDSPDAVRSLLATGVNVFRLNASHGNLAEHGARIDRVRAAENSTGLRAAILLDLQGPKIRLGQFANGGCKLEAGAELTITTREVLGNAALASTSYSEFARDVTPGSRVLLADGAVELQVVETDGVAARCRVLRGGRVSDRKGINLPGVKVSAPSLTEKDVRDLEFGIEKQVDLIALSFVRSPADVIRCRQEIARLGGRLPVIAKVEKPEALADLPGILEQSDGVMVARGDLGVEMPLDEVPYIQKRIIREARRRGRTVIIATQMLESMVNSAEPTRAEVSDVANAIFDGSDAVMLSAETSIGKFPVEAVRMMVSIAEKTEAHSSFRAYEDLSPGDGAAIGEIVAFSACEAAKLARAKAIVVFTTMGSTARRVSRFRPHVPVIAITPSRPIAHQLCLSFNVYPVLVDGVRSTDQMVEQVESVVRTQWHLQPGDVIAVVAGHPIGSGVTNLLKLHRIAGTAG